MTGGVDHVPIEGWGGVLLEGQLGRSLPKQFIETGGLGL
uniref:Uncharacterized protein n=1 Tax=Arundo donax TaxID=35708 RepID=A0A0A9FGJ9_ARUDO